MFSDESVNNIYLFDKNYIAEEVAYYKEKGVPCNGASYYNTVLNIYERLGICEFILNKDLTACKNAMYNSAIAGIRSIEWSDKNPGINDVTLLDFKFLFPALLSDSIDVVNEIAKLLGNRGKQDGAAVGKITVFTGYLYKYTVLDDYDKAKDYYDKLLTQKDTDYTQYTRIVFDGILSKDKEKIEDGLSKMLLHYTKKVRYIRNTLEERFCIRAVALAKLARMKGIDFQFDHPLAPKELIDFTEMKYDVLDILNNPV